jgi:hypothetical protein
MQHGLVLNCQSATAAAAIQTYSPQSVAQVTATVDTTAVFDAASVEKSAGDALVL